MVIINNYYNYNILLLFISCTLLYIGCTVHILIFLFSVYCNHASSCIAFWNSSNNWSLVLLAPSFPHLVPQQPLGFNFIAYRMTLGWTGTPVPGCLHLSYCPLSQPSKHEIMISLHTSRFNEPQHLSCVLQHESAHDPSAWTSSEQSSRVLLQLTPVIVFGCAHSGLICALHQFAPQ